MRFILLNSHAKVIGAIAANPAYLHIKTRARYSSSPSTHLSTSQQLTGSQHPQLGREEIKARNERCLPWETVSLPSKHFSPTKQCTFNHGNGSTADVCCYYSTSSLSIIKVKFEIILKAAA